MDGFARVIEGDAPPDGADSGRDGQRDSLFMTARLCIAGEDDVREGRVRNLSSGGMMIELDRLIEPDTAVTLEMRGLGTMKGRVAWCTDGRVGVALDRPIDPRRARKPVGGGAMTPVYAKPLPPLSRRG